MYSLLAHDYVLCLPFSFAATNLIFKLFHMVAEALHGVIVSKKSISHSASIEVFMDSLDLISNNYNSYNANKIKIILIYQNQSSYKHIKQRIQLYGNITTPLNRIRYLLPNRSVFPLMVEFSFCFVHLDLRKTFQNF